MTKYILNSGGLRKNPENAAKFFDEIVKGLGKNPRILFCFFAQKRERWEGKYAEYTKGFLGLVNKDSKPTFELALPDKFLDQVKKADAIYIHSGDDRLGESLQRIGRISRKRSAYLCLRGIRV